MFFVVVAGGRNGVMGRRGFLDLRGGAAIFFGSRRGLFWMFQ